MTIPSGPKSVTQNAPDLNAESPQDDAPSHKAARLWVNRLARTLKTCRLYEQSGNATVERFMTELVATLGAFHEEHGPLTLRFTTDDVVFDGRSLYRARTREDNLALPFYRDGIRGMTIMPGVTQDQIEALIASILRVTATKQTDDDLVTLLWEAHLDHLDIDFVPAEGDISTGVEAEDDEPMPWPEAEEEQVSQVVLVEDDTASPGTRSDDWTMQEVSVEIESGFADLERLAPTEVRRFHEEYRAEHEVPVTTAAIAVTQAFLAAGGVASDGSELGRFLPRVIREALGEGRWLEAATAVRSAEVHVPGAWGKETFVQELMQPSSIAGLCACLDTQGEELVLDFIDFALTLGDTEVDVLVAMLAHAEHRRNRAPAFASGHRALSGEPRAAGAVAVGPALVRGAQHRPHPRLDRRRRRSIGLLQIALRHPEPRVRQEVVAALGQVDRAAGAAAAGARCSTAPTRGCSARCCTSFGERDASTARLRARAMLQTRTFEQRPAEERRAIYSALGADRRRRRAARARGRAAQGQLVLAWQRDPPPGGGALHRAARHAAARRALERGAQLAARAGAQGVRRGAGGDDRA